MALLTATLAAATLATLATAAALELGYQPGVRGRGKRYGLSNGVNSVFGCPNERNEINLY